MLYRPLEQSEIRASGIGLGTAAIGGEMWGGASEAESIAATQAAIDAAVTLMFSVGVEVDNGNSG